MSWQMRCKCDGCGAWKGDVNGWTLGAYALARENAELPLMLGFCRWDDRVAKLESTLHFCSDGCMRKLLDGHLAAPKLIEQPEDEALNLAAEALPVVQDERTYAPIECAWCGPHCYGGAAHHARVEAGDCYSDGGEM
jgi:hypothetical protein